MNKIWMNFQNWYGGGPSISVVGPPVSDTRRWQIHVDVNVDENTSKPNLAELALKLDNPDDVQRKGGQAAVAIKLKGGRR